MFQRLTRFWIVSLILLTLSFTAVSAQSETFPQYTPTPCPVEFLVSTEATCGTVTVPQDRAHLDERTVSLAVVVFAARSATPAPDPLLYLDGGPGARTLDSFASGLGDFMARLNRDRDVIIFDYRGMGYSDPAMTCPESIGVEDLSWIPVCRARFEALGVDVTDYTTRDNAADAADVVRALGYSSYNIWGGSYGSSVAMTLLRDHPENIRAAIVTALQPPQGDLQSARPIYLMRTIEAVSALCEANEACSAQFSDDMTTALMEVVARLDANPIPVETDGVVGELNGIDVLAVLSEMLKDETKFPIVPGFVAALYAGQYDAVMPYANALSAPPDPLNPMGAWLSMRCTDSILVPSEAEIEAALQSIDPSLWQAAREGHQFQVDECHAWGARVPTEADRMPASTDTPVLIISGALDPFSSQEWLDSTLETLPNGYGFMLPYYAHFVIHDRCASRLLVSFVQDPTIEPDARCLATIMPPIFITH